MSFKDFLKEISGKECKTKVVATHQMTEDQKALWTEVVEKRATAKAMMAEADTLRKKFWNKVEGELNEFDRSLQVNDTDMTIEIHEDDCDNCEEKK